MKSYTIEKNHICLAVGEMLLYKQKNLTTLYNRIRNSTGKSFKYLEFCTILTHGVGMTPTQTHTHT